MVIDRYNSAMTLDQRIVFIGAGNMTEALVAGLLKAEIAPANNIFATDIVPARREHMKTRFGIEVAKDNRHVVERAHILILSVEPQDLDEVLVSIRGSVSLPNGIGVKKRVVAFCREDNIKAAKEAGAVEAGGDEARAAMAELPVAAADASAPRSCLR